MLFLAFSSISCDENEGNAGKDNDVKETKNEIKKEVEKQQNDDKTQQKETEKQAKEKTVRATQVELKTSSGDIVIELDTEKAPITVANFLNYAKEGHYNSTIFHRVIKDFMIQGGGFTADMDKKVTKPPIKNEASNGLVNLRGTIAMARTPHPDSATCQFFINHKDNPNLNYIAGKSAGYAVFGKVVKGMETVDKIAVVKTTTKAGMRDVPVEPVLIESAKIISD
ncbi:MAG: peptidyl-prolyl cis-trans isomerase [Sedimentisphaerales bacterium]|nr:peptidyl-prolyl cis-trans isomerase [Sedimentisphaerales bacterium]